MYNHELGSYDKSWLSALKSDVETSKGFVKIPSRYIYTPVNSPVLLMSSVLYLVKLIKSEVRTHTHQALITSCLPYICKLSTSDNKNAGTYLEFVPGITFSSRKVCEFSSSEIEKILLEFNSNLIKKNENIEREEDDYKLINEKFMSVKERSKSKKESDCIILYSNDYKKILLPTNIVRLDILISEIVKKCGNSLPIDFYYRRKERIGIIGIFEGLPLCEKFRFTPLTRECLLKEYSEYWSEKLSAKIDGNVPIFGVTSHLIRFANHSATAKLTAGVFGLKHALSLPITCKVNNFSSQFQALAYPQNDLLKCILHPFQLAVVCIASLSSDGVEDGIIVSKRARDLGFGMTISQIPPLTLNITSMPTDKIEFIFYNESKRFEKREYNEKCDNKTNENKYQKSEEKGNIFKKIEDNENDYYEKYVFYKKEFEKIDFFAEIEVKRKILECKSVICDILGVTNFMSFSLNLSAIHIGSSTRIFYDNPYDLEEEDESSISLERVFIFRKKNDIVVNFIVNTIKLLDIGDKYSTVDGQKATVVNVKSIEDMPFFSSKNNRIPLNPDIVVNISSSKRQTLGLNIGGVMNMLKCEYPDEIDLMLFNGDKSVRHMQLLQHLLKLCLKHEIIGCEKIYDGTTGEIFRDENGNAISGDIYLIPFLRYEQQGNKVASYTKGETIPRTLQGGFVVKSRGKKGGLKIGQADQFVLMSEGSIPSLFKQNQLKSEPTMNYDRYSGKITQSACAAMKTFDMLDYNVEIY
ncbi:DNA-directed RNA polymerase subunit B' [Dinothrombium tinctorium]|uniref:DNA-directed RNA polymerase n=1 Tax=Dinothrombium tinctorium TaxID=1965070 RepID=A0A3S3P7F4_9ACAR|nr:DNA-directed RNA polymerase subunit B' [Dinothrombium tinctorium]